MSIDVLPLTDDRWPLLARLFGKQGAVSGCWCLYFVQDPKTWRTHKSAGNEAAFHAEVSAGPSPGLLAIEGGAALGWMRIGPRAAVPRWNNARRASAPVDVTDAADRKVWAISCFFFARGARGKGLMRLLIEEGLTYARRHDAAIVEACPIAKDRNVSHEGLFVGAEAPFEACGFERIAERHSGRPLMRKVL